MFRGFLGLESKASMPVVHWGMGKMGGLARDLCLKSGQSAAMPALGSRGGVDGGPLTARGDPCHAQRASQSRPSLATSYAVVSQSLLELHPLPDAWSQYQ